VLAKSIRLGLTGGIASGKSTVAAAFATLGACVIDADSISRAATAQNGPAVSAIRDHFGPDIVNAIGQIDRDRLRQLVFSNPEAKLVLEKIIHPMVRKAIAQRATDAEQQGIPCIVFDIPLLVETGTWRQQLHRILVIDCTHETQISRVKYRNGLNQEEVVKILDMQASRRQRLASADAVIFNDRMSIADLERQVRKMAPQFGL
jgi:dephospho-CoA kinase